MSENNYGGDQIQILKGLEAVRKRPGMYISAVHHQGGFITLFMKLSIMQ